MTGGKDMAPAASQHRAASPSDLSPSADATGLRGVASHGAWQPIETAPSHRPVLLWKETTREHYVAAKIDGGHGPGWCTPDGFEIFRATHWMPLPPAPEQSK